MLTNLPMYVSYKKFREGTVISWDIQRETLHVSQAPNLHEIEELLSLQSSTCFTCWKFSQCSGEGTENSSWSLVGPNPEQFWDLLCSVPSLQCMISTWKNGLTHTCPHIAFSLLYNSPGFLTALSAAAAYAGLRLVFTLCEESIMFSDM